MKPNNYKTDGKLTILYLTRKDGSVVETIIDTEDYERVSHIRWHAHWSPKTNTFYVQGNTRIKDKKILIYLHRFITDCAKSLSVDHINHNTLDNRKSNLRVCSKFENMQNLNGCQSNNKTTKVLGVCFDKRQNKFKAYIFFNKKKKHLGYFENLEDAELAIKAGKAKYISNSLEQKEITNPDKYLKEIISNKKLSKEDVITIKNDKSSTHSELARKFNVSPSHIQKIRAGLKHKDITLLETPELAEVK